MTRWMTITFPRKRPTVYDLRTLRYPETPEDMLSMMRVRNDLKLAWARVITDAIDRDGYLYFTGLGTNQLVMSTLDPQLWMDWDAVWAD